MQVRKALKLSPIAAGALIGALAALIVGGYAQLNLYLNCSEGTFTGAPQGLDQWTYFSMARAVWRSPNFITYHYPYELFWPTPPVVFQLPITVLAWIGWFTGLPIAFEIGRVAGAAGAGAGIAAIGLHFPRGFWRKWFYLAMVLGGGLFSFGAMVASMDVAGIDGLTESHQYMRHSMGPLLWWLPYLGMNFRMPLECIYHAMAIVTIACLMRQRQLAAFILGIMLWMSNPFSAVAIHGAVVPWLAWNTWESRGPARRKNARYLLGWFLVNGGAAIYYGWFLKCWPLFQDLERMYAMAIHQPLEWWRLLMLMLPYGYGLAATLVVRPLWRAVWGTSKWRLFAIMAVVHVVLLQHAALLGERSMQAFHYNRGYLHLALVVVAWRVLMIVLQRCRLLRISSSLPFGKPWTSVMRGPGIAGSVVAALVLISCLDQIFFNMYTLSRPGVPEIVDESYVKLARLIPEKPAPMLVYTEFGPGYSGSYISAFTPHVAWDAQESMVVPFYEKRIELADEAFNGKHGGLAGLGIDYAIVYSASKEKNDALINQNWKRVAEEGMTVLYRAPQVSTARGSLNRLTAVDIAN